jgi:tetratricopeptide (TPR) repeat protein
MLSSSTGSSSNTAYLDIPWNMHLNQARADRDAGNLAAVMEQLRACNKLLPGNSDLAIEWVQQMDARHEPAMADELFNASYGIWDQLAQKYPRSGWMHNVAAWTAASCNRKLAEAVSHAKTAVQLAPSYWAFLDTLAEAEFHAGHRDLAITAARQALAALPKDDFLQRRLTHFTSDPLPSH